MATGRATLSISGRDMAAVPAHGIDQRSRPGRHEIRFSNCDDETAAVGRRQRGRRSIAPDDVRRPGQYAAGCEPTAPGRRGFRSAREAPLSHLAIFRDIYYIADLSSAEQPSFDGDMCSPIPPDALGDDASRRRTAATVCRFSLKADQFFVLGDNSARSKDGRLWGTTITGSPASLLIGKALFIYWPHSWNKIRTPWFNVPVSLLSPIFQTEWAWCRVPTMLEAKGLVKIYGTRRVVDGVEFPRR